MKQFLPDELVRFLTAVDAALEQPVTVIIIGGSAAAVAYGISRGTRDVDTWTKVTATLDAAVRQARQATGLDVPFSHSGVADGPHDFEARLRRTLPELDKLEVLVPERHDLVLMKAIRGYEHDLEQIEEMHRQEPLDLDTLVDRYENEMGAVVGDPSRLRGNILLRVERLYPREAAAIEVRLGREGRR
jgi:hypothetical protein